MAAPKLSFFEKVANTAGVIYRYHASHFPRRWDILKKVAERELAPPLPKDLPAIKADLKNVLKAIETKAYKNLTVRVSCLSNCIFCLEQNKIILHSVIITYTFFTILFV